MDIQNLLSKSTSLSLDQIRSVMANPSLAGPSSIGEALAQKEYSSADELVAELCRELGLEFIKDIPIGDIPVDLVRYLPINYAKQQCILPFKEDQETVTILTSNPVNLKALDDLRVVFSKKVRPLVTTNQKLQEAINRVYEKSTANLQGLDEIEEEEVDLDDPIIDLLEAGTMMLR